MTVAIIVAMQKELDLLLPQIENLREHITNQQTYYLGEISGHEVIALKSGIGKVNAAISTYELLRTFSPACVINTGVAGGLGLTDTMDLLVATEVVYNDVWCGPDTSYGAAHGFPTYLPCCPEVIEEAQQYLTGENVRFGLLSSGDKFVATAEEVEFIHSYFPEAMAVDMESGAIVQTCTRMHVPVAVVRVISDTPGRAENISQYQDFWSEAPAETLSALKTLVAHLPHSLSC